MPASFPTAVKTFTSRNAGDVIQPAHVNDLQDEVAAIETGYLTGTAPLVSSHVSAAAGLSVVGNSTLASTITIGTLPYIFPSSGGSTGQALVIVSTSGSTMTLEWRAPTQGGLTLLKSGNGTDATAGATTVDSVALSGLTANDSLKVQFQIEASSQSVGTVVLQHVTDTITLVPLSTSPLAAGASASVIGEAIVRQRQGNSTSITSVAQAMTGAPSRLDSYLITSPTTAWTGSWTLGLRHGGVTAGGTFKWAWSVHKLAGQ